MIVIAPFSLVMALWVWLIIVKFMRDERKIKHEMAQVQELDKKLEIYLLGPPRTWFVINGEDPVDYMRRKINTVPVKR